MKCKVPRLFYEVPVKEICSNFVSAPGNESYGEGSMIGIN